MTGLSDIADHADQDAVFEREIAGELVVVGGGLAGLCLAIAAAREGCRTLLVHNRPVLGGNSSSEARVVPAGASHHSAWARETGLIEELLLTDRAANHDQFWANGLTNSMYDLVLYTVATRQPQLTVLLNTHVDRVDTDGAGTITAIEGIQVSTGRRIRLRGRQFADCTGDAAVARLAGAESDYGREAGEEYDEPLAPPRRDRQTAGSTISFKARDVGRPVPFVPPEWTVPYRRPEDLGPLRESTGLDRPEFGGFWWFEIGYPYHQITGTEDVRDALYRHVLGVWDYLKNYHPQRERLAHYALDWVGSVVAKRESARVLGDVVLSERHCHTDQRWPDRIAGAGWFLDLHNPHGLLRAAEPSDPATMDEHVRAWVRVPPFSVPLRACYSRTVGNLWLGGRLISATRVANGALRVQQTLAQLGQATGIAAAYALAHGLSPRQAAEPVHSGRIQQRALYQDVRIPGLRLSWDGDLAQSATVTASSHAALDLGTPDDTDTRRLDRPWAQVFPVSTDRIDALATHLANNAASKAALQWRLERVDTLWQREGGVVVAEGEHTLEAGHRGWVTIPVNASVTPGTLHRFALCGDGATSWTTSALQPVGTLAQFFHDARKSSGGSPNLPPFAHWCQDKWTTLTLTTAPAQFPYTPDNVVNGVAYPESWTNLWISNPHQPLPQWLDFTWRTPVHPRRVSMWFDTNLNAKLGLAPGLWRAPECVRDYQVLIRAAADSPGQVVGEARDNHQRLNRLELPGTPVTTLRIEIAENNEHHVAEHHRAQLEQWQRDGRRQLQTTTPCGARLYQVVIE